MIWARAGRQGVLDDVLRRKRQDRGGIIIDNNFVGSASRVGLA